MKHFKLDSNNLSAKFKFEDFINAFAFISKVAIISEKLNHHPTIVNTYNSVEIFLSTHDAGNTVTEKDYELAEKIEALI